MPSSAGGLGCRAGSGAVGLNAQAPIFYPNFGSWNCHAPWEPGQTGPNMGCVGLDGPATPGLDVALHQAPYNVPYGEMARNEFNYARFHVQHLVV